MCNPPEGYVKSGYDYMFIEHTYFWNRTLCKYVLLSSLYDMLPFEYDSYHNDPNYAAMFTDGGSDTATNIDINNGSNGKNIIDKSLDYLLTPSQPQSKKKNALIIILIVAAVCIAAYAFYRFRIKK